MANVSIAPAVRQLNPHRYNPYSIASIDFGEFVVHRFIETEKTDDWKSVQADGFLRLAALDFPAYGRVSLKSAAFFVPTFQLLQNIDGFRSHEVSDKGQPCIMPMCRIDICNLLCSFDNTFYTVAFAGADYTRIPDPDSPNTPYDFLSFTKDTQSDIPIWAALKLTAKGKRVYKWLKSLGYDFVTYQPSNSYSTLVESISYTNCLNILAYAKVWADYFCNIHLYQSNKTVQMLKSIKDGQDYKIGNITLYDSATGHLELNGVLEIWNDTLVPFQSNMYTNAWNSEMSPIGDISNNSQPNGGLIGPHLPETNANFDKVVLSTLSTYITNHSANDIKILSQYGINSLQAAFKFVRRNGLFGSEPVKQAFARYGIKGDDFNSMFARKLFEASSDIDFSAVMSNSNTVDPDTDKGSVLGAYAGVGLCGLNFNYNYKATDYGVILNLSWLQIVPLQIHGFDPSTLRRLPLDWYTPEYDGKAIRAIPLMEISSNRKIVTVAANKDEQVFGYTGIYDEYRRMRDVVLGDFVFGNAKKFYFGRDLSEKRENYRFAIVPQSNSIQYFNRWGSQPDLTDAFQYSVDNGDRFYLQLIYKIEADRPMLSDADALDLTGSGEVETSTNSNPNA